MTGDAARVGDSCPLLMAPPPLGRHNAATGVICTRSDAERRQSRANRKAFDMGYGRKRKSETSEPVAATRKPAAASHRMRLRSMMIRGWNMRRMRWGRRCSGREWRQPPLARELASH